MQNFFWVRGRWLTREERWRSPGTYALFVWMTNFSVLQRAGSDSILIRETNFLTSIHHLGTLYSEGTSCWLISIGIFSIIAELICSDPLPAVYGKLAQFKVDRGVHVDRRKNLHFTGRILRSQCRPQLALHFLLYFHMYESGAWSAWINHACCKRKLHCSGHDICTDSW